VSGLSKTAVLSKFLTRQKDKKHVGYRILDGNICYNFLTRKINISAAAAVWLL